MGTKARRLPELSVNLKRFRKAAGFNSAEALAHAADVSIATVKNVERGTHGNLERNTIEKLAETCGVSVGDLTGELRSKAWLERVETYLASDDAIAIKPTEEEKTWLTGLGGLSWLGGSPTDASITYMLLALRKRQLSSVPPP